MSLAVAGGQIAAARCLVSVIPLAIRDGTGSRCPSPFCRIFYYCQSFARSLCPPTNGSVIAFIKTARGERNA